MHPSRLYLSPTNHCNCRCGYCYVLPEMKLARDEADDDFFISVLDDFMDRQPRRAGSFFDPQLRFIGGEPYLRFGLMAGLIRRFHDRFPQSLALINTNGTLVSEETAAAFAGTRGTVQHVVSLDGPRAVHNKRRGLLDQGDGFERTTTGIRLLCARSLPVKVNVVLDLENEHALVELFRVVKTELGLDDISVSLRQSPLAPLSPEDQFRLLALAYELAEKEDLTVTGHHRLHLGGTIPGLRCRAGEISVLVTSQKQVTGCQRFILDRERLAYEPGVFAAAGAALAGFPERKCYSDHDLELGAKLHGLYQQRYPHYLSVSDTDRIVFGII
jgi:MoaA/NifB/PqqE/SkfB family radical SAM enzyme